MMMNHDINVSDVFILRDVCKWLARQNVLACCHKNTTGVLHLVLRHLSHARHGTFLCVSPCCVTAWPSKTTECGSENAPPPLLRRSHTPESRTHQGR